MTNTNAKGVARRAAWCRSGITLAATVAALASLVQGPAQAVEFCGTYDSFGQLHSPVGGTCIIPDGAQNTVNYSNHGTQILEAGSSASSINVINSDIGTLFDFNGTFTQIQSTFFVNGALDIGTEGHFINNARIIVGAGTLNNAGFFENASEVSVYGFNGGKVINAVGGIFQNDAGATLKLLGGTTLKNYGTLADRGTITANDFMFNQAAYIENYGTFATGAATDLVGGTFTNAGTLAPGGSNTIVTSVLKGGLVQTANGTIAIDADWATSTADKVEVQGAATLAGHVLVNPLNFPSSTDPANTGLKQTFTILSATGGITNTGIAVTDTAAVDYKLLFPDANTMTLDATINFVPEPAPGQDGFGTNGLTTNQTAVGRTLNTIVSGGGTLGFVPALLAVPTVQGLAQAFDQLSPNGDGGAVSSALTTGNTFAGQLRSCRTAGETGDGNAIIHEGQCLWVRAQARRLDFSGGSGGVGYEETGTFYSAGAQVDLGGDWRLGGGLGLERTTLQSDSNARTDTDRVHVGAVLKYNPGPWLFAGSFTGGHGWLDNQRAVAFAGFADTATSHTGSNFVSGRLTAAYLESFGALYLKPQVDVAVTYLERGAYTEQAAGGIALSVAGSDDVVVSVSPALELGADLRLASGGVARPFVRAGITWLDTGSFATTAAFADDVGATPFTIVSKVDTTVADLSAGVDLISSSGMALRLQYDGRFGEETELHAGTAKLSVPF
jgi:uncharacterized protein with beta-barrel porin domain